MISIRNTKNLTGVTIGGDYNDLYELVEAFHEIAIDEFSKEFHEYVDMSTRLLGICYDIRHAYQGDRELAFVDNHLSGEMMKYHEMIAPKQNLYYECNCLYPEMIFGMIAINELINVRIKVLSKKNHLHFDEYSDKNVIWDRTITVLRGFQSAFAKCVRETLSPNSYSRWLKSAASLMTSAYSMDLQYIDDINIEYMGMTREKRLKSFTSITRRIADYWKEEGCDDGKHNIELYGIDYPDDIEW